MKDKFGNKLNLSQILEKIINRIYSYFADFSLMLIRWIGFIPFHLIRKYFYNLAGMSLPISSTIHMWARFYSLKNIIVGFWLWRW